MNPLPHMAKFLYQTQPHSLIHVLPDFNLQSEVPAAVLIMISLELCHLINSSKLDKAECGEH